MMTKSLKFCALTLLAAMLITCVQLPLAKAAHIDTSNYMQSRSGVIRSNIQCALAREDVRERLIAFGVDPSDAEKRIASLTAEELSQLRQHIENLPVGGDILAVLGIVFVVLIILEIVGVTNVFSKL